MLDYPQALHVGDRHEFSCYGLIPSMSHYVHVNIARSGKKYPKSEPTDALSHSVQDAQAVLKSSLQSLHGWQ